MPTSDKPEAKRCPHDGGYCHHQCDNPVAGNPPEPSGHWEAGKCFREESGMHLTTPSKGYPLSGHEFPPGGENVVLAVVSIRKRTRGGLGGSGPVTTYSGHIEISDAAEPERDQVASEKTHPRMLVQPLASALGALLREKI